MKRISQRRIRAYVRKIMTEELNKHKRKSKLNEWYDQYDSSGSMSLLYAIHMALNPDGGFDDLQEQLDMEAALSSIGHTKDTIQEVAMYLPSSEDGVERPDVEIEINKARDEGFTHYDTVNMDGYNPIYLMVGALTPDAKPINRINDMLDNLYSSDW